MQRCHKSRRTSSDRRRKLTTIAYKSAGFGSLVTLHITSKTAVACYADDRQSMARWASMFQRTCVNAFFIFTILHSPLAIRASQRYIIPCGENGTGPQWQLPYGRPVSTLEYVAIDILGPLIRSSAGFRYVLAITNRFSKLTKTVPLRSITALAVSKANVTHWAI